MALTSLVLSIFLKWVGISTMDLMFITIVDQGLRKLCLKTLLHTIGETVAFTFAVNSRDFVTKINYMNSIYTNM